MDNQPIVLERMFNVPPSKVWKAITDRNEMKEWYFDLPEYKAEAGFKFQFSGGPTPDRQYLHLCEVTEAIPGRKLTHSWRYDGYAGISFVTFELLDQGGHTLLKFSHSGIETFPADNPDLAKKNFVEGWNQIIQTSLKEYLEGGGNSDG